MNKIGFGSIFLFFAILLALPVSLVAQTTLPVGPLVKFPTGDAAWSVEITYRNKPPVSQVSDPGMQAPATGQPTMIEVTRIGHIARYRTAWSNKQTTEDWLTEKFSFIDDPVTHRINLIPNAYVVLDYNRQDESRFTWIKPETFVAVEDFHGKSCYHFRQDVTLPEQSGQLAGFQQGTVHSEAWIEKETLLPAGFDDSQALYIYTFKPTPTGELTLPAKYLSEKSQYENAFKPPKQLGK